MDEISNSFVGVDAGDQSLVEGARTELERILSDDAFQASARRRDMLRFIVEETLCGRGGRLTAVPIAQTVFGRDETFDHQSDPVVRVEARRLRRDLDSYYSGPGSDNPFRIRSPKGSYVAQFESVQSSDDAPEKQTGQRSPSRFPAMRWMATGGILAACVAAVFVTWFVYRTPESGAMQAANYASVLDLPKGRSIAVLPFLNLSGDSRKQHISDGISEQIATELARFRDLWVMPLGSVQQHRDGLADVNELRQKYNVDFILEGSVRLLDGTIRITSRLIDAENAHYIWVRTFNNTLNPANIYDVQDAIAQEVSANLAGKYGVVAHQAMTRSKRKPPQSFEAYDCVLRYYEYQNSISPALYSDVRTCLEKAVEMEPDYAEAWAVLANIYIQAKRFGYGEGDAADDIAGMARDAAERAIELDPQSSTAHVILSTLLFTEGDLDGFRAAGEKAVQLNPNNSDALAHYGLRVAISGDWDTGLPLLEKAMTLNPEFPPWYRFAGVFRDYELENYEAALSKLNQIDMPGFLWTHLLRSAVLGQMGRLEEAQSAVDALTELSGDFESNGMKFIRVWQMPDSLRLQIVEGLSKAGLDLVEAPSG